MFPPALHTACLPSPGQSCLCFETGQHSGSWCLPFVPALMELMNGAALCAQFECCGSIVLLGTFRSPISPPFLNIRALFIGLLWHGTVCSYTCHPAYLLSISSGLSSPLLPPVLLSVPNSPPPSIEPVQVPDSSPAAHALTAPHACPEHF